MKIAQIIGYGLILAAWSALAVWMVIGMAST